MYTTYVAQIFDKQKYWCIGIEKKLNKILMKPYTVLAVANTSKETFDELPKTC